MRVKASTIIKACYNREYEKRFAYRYAHAGYPPLEVIWDIPKTPENLKLVKEFLLDYSPEFNPFAKFLRSIKKEDEAKKKGMKEKCPKTGNLIDKPDECAECEFLVVTIPAGWVCRYRCREGKE